MKKLESRNVRPVKTLEKQMSIVDCQEINPVLTAFKSINIVKSSKSFKRIPFGDNYIALLRHDFIDYGCKLWHLLNQFLFDIPLNRGFENVTPRNPILWIKSSR